MNLPEMIAKFTQIIEILKPEIYFLSDADMDKVIDEITDFREFVIGQKIRRVQQRKIHDFAESQKRCNNDN